MTASSDQAPREAKSYLISCGGTGGHLSPGIALAEALTARGHRATLLISQKKIDARLAGKYPHLAFVAIPGAPFTWKPVGLVRFLITHTRGFFQSWSLVRRHQPAAVVGFGGFTATAIIVAAALRRVPVALHEANRVPGKATRVLSRFARRVYLPVGVKLPEAKPESVRYAGLPVRQEIRRLDRREARARFSLAPDGPVVVVFGGSQGATPLNEWARRELPQFAANGVQFCCVTGPGKGPDEVLELKSQSGATVRAVFMTFCDDVAALLSAADLVVGRAGAGTIAELIRCETPAVLVPYPQAADNHQAENARVFAQQGGGLVVEQQQLGFLGETVRRLLADESVLQRMKGQLRQMDQADSFDQMLNDLERLSPVGCTEGDEDAGANA